MKRGSEAFQRDFIAGLDIGIKRVAKAIVDEGGAYIERHAFDRGDLLASGEVEQKGTAHYRAKWTSAYAKNVHDGRKPGSKPPPFKAILGWVRRNLSYTIFQGLSGTTRTYAFKAGEGRRVTNEKLLEQVAWAVRAKIARDGIPPKPFAVHASQRVGPKAAGIVNAEIRRYLRRGGNRTD